MIKTNQELQLMANAIRMLSVDAIAKANSGHPGMPMGFADVATVLFSEFLKFNANDPKWADRDRFILSAGHGSMLLYSLLYLTGYEDCTIEDIKNFRQLHAKTAGHPEYGYLAGVETTTGPLGQGVANAVGMAISEKMMEARFDKDLVDHKIYCVVGDGCLMEGVSYEALNIAGYLNLDNLIVLWDNNEITIDGSTKISRKEDMKMRMESNGFKYIEADGQNFDSIRNALTEAQISTKPTFISFKTLIGCGSPTKCGTSKVHGSPIKGEDLDLVRKELNWEYPPFEVPSEVLKNWRDAGTRNLGEMSDWKNRLAKSAKREEFLNLLDGKLPSEWKTKLANFKKTAFLEKPNEATRKSSNRVLEVLTADIPAMIGGSADLTGSVLTQTSSTKQALTPEDFSGRYINYGIREHGMAAIMNGIKLHSGFIPYGGTFFCFSDYEKPAIRLSALMGLQVIYVLTHDSIGLGEDGPTHQPIEHLAALRAMPNILVMRPANLQETIECYEIAIEANKTPTAMVLSRQNVAFLSRESDENMSKKGMYIFSDSDKTPDVTLVATGTEVDIAMATKTELEKSGLAVRVVSAPCWSLFEQQSEDYKKSVLGDGLKVGIEAACSFGWDKYVDMFCGIPDGHFGISAPAEQIYDYFGITPKKISEKIFKRIK